MSKSVKVGEESLTEEMISTYTTEGLSLSNDKVTFWQSYKKILVPASVVTGTIIAAGTGLAVYFTKDTNPPPHHMIH